ncbi:MAG: hypothetical protein AB8I08_10160 [Sandaracinaceae bacterium]
MRMTKPRQSCTVPIGDQRVAMEVSGSLRFGRDNPTLHVDFNGQARADVNGVAGGDSAQFSWSFDGRRPAD